MNNIKTEKVIYLQSSLLSFEEQKKGISNLIETNEY